MRQVLEEPYGNTKLVLEYNDTQEWIHADWIGVHSLPSIKRGTEAIVALFNKTGCSKYLSDNTNLIGSFDSAGPYLVEVFTPAAMRAGMRFVAHILSPGVYAKQSMYSVAAQLPENLTIKLFDNIEDAKRWLAAC